jgi:hypothetical protein
VVRERAARGKERMLVKFDSEVGSLTMFGDVAVKLLEMMGHSGTVPSAILAQDLPPALERLRKAVADGRPVQPESMPQDEDSESDRPAARKISLQQRAFPLIQLLERAAKAKADVMWDYQR